MIAAPSPAQASAETFKRLLTDHANAIAACALDPGSGDRAVVGAKLADRTREGDCFAGLRVRLDLDPPALWDELGLRDLNGLGTRIDETGDRLPVPTEDHHDRDRG